MHCYFEATCCGFIRCCNIFEHPLQNPVLLVYLVAAHLRVTVERAHWLSSEKGFVAGRRLPVLKGERAVNGKIDSCNVLTDSAIAQHLHKDGRTAEESQEEDALEEVLSAPPPPPPRLLPHILM